jgi:hypothetical protein
VGEEGDVDIDDLAVDKAPGLLVAGVGKEPPAGPHHDRVHLQIV